MSTQAGSESQSTRRFIGVAEPATKSTPYAVLTDYLGADTQNAVGQVYRFEINAGTSKAMSALSTNDNLSVIWASPEGNLWVGTALGNIWTTSAVDWDTSAIDGLDFEQVDPDFTWKAIELPLRPNENGCRVSAIWGSSDRDVHVGTREGRFLHWDGKAWQHSYVDNGYAIQALHGTDANSVWAVGRKGVVLHFDGKNWRRIRLPAGDEREDLTGVWATSTDQVHICSSAGVVFTGDPKGLTHLGRGPSGFQGIAGLNADLYLSAQKGVCALRSGKLSFESDQLVTTGIYRLNSRLAFVEAQQEIPGLVIHDPANIERPWIGCKAR